MEIVMPINSRNGNRDLFNAGKGDKERSSKWRENMDDIDWHRDEPDGFRRAGAVKLVKYYRRYLPQSVEDLQASIEAHTEWLIACPKCGQRAWRPFVGKACTAMQCAACYYIEASQMQFKGGFGV